MLTLVLATLLSAPPTTPPSTAPMSPPLAAPKTPSAQTTATTPSTATTTSSTSTTSTAPKTATSQEGPVYTGVRPEGALGAVHAIYVDISENDDFLTPPQRETRTKLRAILGQDAAIVAHGSTAFRARLSAWKAQCAKNEALEPECEADPVLCAQDNWIPVGIDVVKSAPRAATIDVRQPGKGNVKVRTTLVLEGKAWKLDGVECAAVDAGPPR